MPGKGAWKAGLRVGDRIEQINGRPVQQFHADLKVAVSLGDVDQGVSTVVRHPGVAEPLKITRDGHARPGALGSGDWDWAAAEHVADGIAPAVPGSSAALSRPPLPGRGSHRRNRRRARGLSLTRRSTPIWPVTPNGRLTITVEREVEHDGLTGGGPG